jgi:hypothetical protein
VLVALALFVQYVRIDFINTSGGAGVLEEKELAHSNTTGTETVLIIADTQNDVLSRVKTHVEYVLAFMGLSYDQLDVRAINNYEFDYDYVVVIVSDLSVFKDIQGLFQYIEDGGKVVFPYRLEFNDVFSGAYRLLGISEHGEFEDVNGIVFDDSIILHAELFKESYSEHIVNSSISVQLNDASQRLMHASNNLSLAWTFKYGKGDIVYFNGTMLASKDHRGVLLGLINTLRPVKAYPYLNGQGFLIQHMPGPIPDGSVEHLLNDYNRSTLRYYKEIWWTDLLDLSTRLNQVINSSLLGTYSNYQSENIEDYYFLLRDNLSVFGREILTGNGEIALNGFNHLPLEIGDTWMSLEEIEKAYNLLESYFKVIFTNYDWVSYVVTDNTMDQQAYDFLRDKGFLIFITNYHERADFKGELSINQHVELPIINYGYDMDSEAIWRMLNMKSAFGYYLHSIYADDPLSEGFSWKESYEDLYDFLEIGEELYPHIKSLSLSDLARSFIQSRQVPSYDKVDDEIRVKYEGEETQIIIRVDEEILEISGGQLEQIDENYYILTLNQNVVIRLEK